MSGERVVILLVLALFVIVNVLQALHAASARRKYEAALARLTAAPADNALRVAALAAGRRYVKLARRAAIRKSSALFDEVALNNDLAARAPLPAATSGEKECPRCAELVKAAAKICRFCNYAFEGERDAA